MESLKSTKQSTIMAPTYSAQFGMKARPMSTGETEHNQSASPLDVVQLHWEILTNF